MSTKLLTHEANEAFGWMIDRMPDRIFKAFASEMEASMRVTAMRFGFDEELTKAFSVAHLISRRPDLPPAEDETQMVQADIYGGKHTYAVISGDVVLRKGPRGQWNPTSLAIQEVKACSITRVTETIKVKAKFL